MVSEAQTTSVGTFVAVGNLPGGFERLIRLAWALRSVLPQPVFVQKGRAALPEGVEYEAVDFVSSREFSNLIRDSKIVLGHCGVGLFLSCNRFAKCPLLVPRSSVFREHIDEHQMELAEKLESDRLAWVIRPGMEVTDIEQIVRVQLENPKPCPTVEMEAPDIEELGARIVAVASVGGHRQELTRWVHKQPCDKIYVTDAWCQEVEEGSIKLFPSCADRRLFPLRVLQAGRFLTAREGYSVLTNGAGVGAAFVLAASVLGRKSYIVESLTRIKAPSTWFRVSSRCASKCFAYEWAEWAHSYRRRVQILGVLKTSN